MNADVIEELNSDQVQARVTAAILAEAKERGGWAEIEWLDTGKRGLANIKIWATARRKALLRNRAVLLAVLLGVLVFGAIEELIGYHEQAVYCGFVCCAIVLVIECLEWRLRQLKVPTDLEIMQGAARRIAEYRVTVQPTSQGWQVRWYLR